MNHEALFLYSITNVNYFSEMNNNISMKKKQTLTLYVKFNSNLEDPTLFF